MPRYDYLCSGCHRRVELTLSLKESDTVPACKVCGQALVKQPSAPGFVVNGFSERNGYARRQDHE